MDFFDKLAGKDKEKKKKKGILSRIITFITLMSALPIIFNILIILLVLFLIFVACAGIMQIFQEEEPVVGAYDIDWGNYTCTCTFLTAEQILQVQAGNSVNVDLNAGSLNVSGGSVVNINGLVVPSLGSLKEGVGEYGIPIWSGYSMSDTGSDVIVPVSTDNRIEPSVTFTDDFVNANVTSDLLSVSERANHQGSNSCVTTEGTYKINDVAQSVCKLDSDGRLLIAVGSGLIAWPDSPDHNNNMLGLKIDVVLRNGDVIPCTIGDMKADVHTGSLHMYYCGGKYRSFIEAELDHINEGKIYAKPDFSFLEFVRSAPGSTTYLSHYIRDAGGLDHVKVYSHGRLEEGKKVNPNAFSSLDLISNNSNIVNQNTTTSFGTTGTTGVNQNTDVTSSVQSSNVDVSKFVLNGEQTSKGFVIVEGTGGSSCVVSAYKNNGGTWEKFVDTNGVLGRSGMSNTKKEGDGATPIGIWKMNTPFGQKEAQSDFPSNYIKVSEGEGDLADYWSGSTGNESHGFNKLKLNFDKSLVSDFIGEQISSSGYAGFYNYAIDSGYNYNGVESAGSALFLHCNVSGVKDTSGCVAIPESEMIKILKEYEEGYWYIVQAPKGYISSLYNSYGTNNTLCASGNFGTGGSNTNNIASSTVNNNTSNSSTSTSVTSTGLSFTNGQKISLDSSWKYANESVINSGSATYYTATSNRKEICVAVNAGHGTSGNKGKETKSHPDGTGKYTGGTNAQGAVMSQAISSGTTLMDNTPEAVANLKVALAMKDELLSMGYDVLMIRETDDEQLDNIARTVISNNVADCHVAIHFDGTTNDKGAFYMSVVDNDAYKNMEPVKTWWKQHDELGESLLVGLSNNNIKLWSSRKMESDLTQTSYSTIPSVDIELGDTATDISQESCNKFGKGLALGVDEFFKTHSPVNQSKRIGSVSSNIVTNNTTSTNVSNTVVGGLVNRNKMNLRTQCSMESEGLCGCYVSDPNCACHIFGGSDGILGNEDDNIGAIEQSVQQNNNLAGLTAEQQLVLTTARDVMFEMVMGIKVTQPSVYDKAKVTHDDPWYTNLNGGDYRGNVAILINGESKGIRPDCSGYVGAVLNRLGFLGVSNPSTYTFISNSFLDAIRSDDRFILLNYDVSIVEPGDIIIKRNGSAGKGHTEILYEMIDKNNLTVRHYSWGSTGAVLSAYDLVSESMKSIPDSLNYGYYANGNKTVEYIVRYVGSGGTGK